MTNERRRTAAQIWERGAAPPVNPTSPTLLKLIGKVFSSQFSNLLGAPYLPRQRIRERQLARAFELVRLAGEIILVYRKKYTNAGVDLNSLSSWDDFTKLPLISKEELKNEFLFDRINPHLDRSTLHSTRSTGPDEGLGIRIVILQVFHDGDLEIGDALEGTAPDAVSGDLGEEPLDHVEPGSRGRREVQMEAGVLLDPTLRRLTKRPFFATFYTDMFRLIGRILPPTWKALSDCTTINSITSPILDARRAFNLSAIDLNAALSTFSFLGTVKTTFL